MGNVDGSFAFIVSCGEGLWIQVNRHPAHIGKNMCVCLSFLCEPMMWQSSMLISLLVLSREQIYVPTWLIHGSMDRGPITHLDQLVMLVGRHKDMLVKILKRCGPVMGQGRRLENWGGQLENVATFDNCTSPMDKYQAFYALLFSHISPI